MGIGPEDLRRPFGHFGPLKDIYLPRDYYSGGWVWKLSRRRWVVLSFLVVVWGLRLGLFLLMQILNWGEDRHFDEMRSNFGKLAVFWIFQESGDKKYGNVAGYRHYKKTTSPLIPLPQWKLAVLGQSCFLFELPLYNRNLPKEEALGWV
ncbi:hypothetical protein Hdeb2414_s0004g00142001 [Helianthus debilis subsp. tardiflorus]